MVSGQYKDCKHHKTLKDRAKYIEASCEPMLTALTAMKWYGTLLNFCLYPNFYPLFSVKYNITLQYKWQTKKRQLPKTSNHDYKIISCFIKWYNQQELIVNFKDTLNNSNF